MEEVLLIDANDLPDIIKEVTIMPKDENVIENEGMKKYYDIFVELEKKGEWDKIMDLACSTVIKDQNGLMHPNSDIDDAFEKWSLEMYTRNSDERISGDVKEEKLNTFNEFSKAYGRNRAKYAKMVNDDIEKTKEKLKKGEIKGAELWTDNDEALTKIASSYVYEHCDMSKHLHSMAEASDSLLSDIPEYYSSQPLGTLAESIEEHIGTARNIVSKTEKMIGKIAKLSDNLSRQKSSPTLESCKENLAVINKARTDRIHAKVNDVQKKMENASGEELRELAASNIYLTGIEKANKDQKKHFSLEETLSSDAILTGTFKIAETNAFKEMSKLPDDELRSLAVKDGGRQLTAKYLKNRAEEAEMQRSRNATKEMAKEMHLDNKISPKSKEAPTKAVKTI